jgi:transposase
MRAEKTNSSWEREEGQGEKRDETRKRKVEKRWETYKSSANRRHRGIIQTQLKVVDLLRAHLLTQFLTQLLRDVVQKDRVVVRGDIERVGEGDGFGGGVVGGEGFVELFRGEGEDGDLLRLGVVVEPVQ